MPQNTGTANERHVGFVIADWPGTWAALEVAIDKFASDNGVTLESIHVSGV